MHEKTWYAEIPGISVQVINRWNFDGQTEEEIWINDTQVHDFSGNLLKDKEQKPRMGLNITIPYGSHKVQVLCGSAWHLCGCACKIFVDGKYIGGDKIVLFANNKNNLST